MPLYRSFRGHSRPVLTLIASGIFAVLPAFAATEPVEETSPEDESDHPLKATVGRSGDSLSNFSHNLFEGSSAQSVHADLIYSDRRKPALCPPDIVHPTFHQYYSFKENLHDATGFAFTTDYSFLYQRASWVQGDDRNGFSHVLRFLGNRESYLAQVSPPRRRAGLSAACAALQPICGVLKRPATRI